MENLVFTAKKRPKPVSINETAVMRVSAETYNTLRELHSLTGLPMIQILQKITAYAIENMVILEPDMNAEEPDLQEDGDELDRILQIAETLERILGELSAEKPSKRQRGTKSRRYGCKLKGGVLMEQMLYTVKEVAQILKCNPTRVYGLKDAGLLPFLKLGQLKCRREAVEEFLRKYEGYDVSDPNNIVPLEVGAEE